MSGLINVNNTFVNLPPTARSYSVNNRVISNKRSPLDMFGAVELKFTGLVVGTDVVILKAGTSQVLASADQIPNSDYIYPYFTTQSIDIGFIKAGYVTLYIYGYPLSTGNVTLPIQQRVDRNYL